jgi:hypothetical protein
VKWEGYEKKSDRTWEPEENLYYPYPLKCVTKLTLKFLGNLRLRSWRNISRALGEKKK